MPDKIRVLIADDHRLFAEALEAFLSSDDGAFINGELINIAGGQKAGI